MPSYVVGVIAIILALLMIMVGRARNGVPRPLFRSYLSGVLYTVTVEGLLVFGVVWIIFAPG
jgi:hypothetical protein